MKLKFFHVVLILTTILFFKGHGARAQQDVIERLKKTVFFLASDTLCGRQAGSSFEHRSADMIAEAFRKSGLKKAANHSYFQDFSFITDSGETLTSRNVIGQIRHRKAKTIIIGAHYDHIGMGGKYSRSIGKTAVHPGADDNASGVALLLELARVTKKHGSKKFSYIFIAFGAHEPGLFGSTHYVQSSICDTGNIYLMINLDMMGRMDTVSRLLICEKNWSSIPDSLITGPGKSDIFIKTRDMTMGDHTPFMEKSIPALRFTTGIHDDYHTIYDKPDKINYEGMAKLPGYLQQLLMKLSEKEFVTAAEGLPH